MGTKQLKLVDINAVVKYWEANKDYIRNKWAKKIFVGTQEEYILVESQLEPGALVVILEDHIFDSDIESTPSIPSGYNNLNTFNNLKFYTIDDMLFCVKQ